MRSPHPSRSTTETIETGVSTGKRAGAFAFAELQASCTPGYFNDEGKVGETAGWLAGFYPEGSEAFFARIHAWRDDGKLDGLEIS